FEVYAENTMLLIDAKNGMISMLINYECSGIIEMLVYSSLVMFFPFVKFRGKISALLWGNVYIIACNIIRMLSIIYLVRFKGIGAYNIAHTIIGRIIFFIMIIFLYYKVFTKNQLTNQKVGEIN
ncbi:MAG: exosortase family protein XrtG, partial [Clostridium sp.]